MNTAKPQLLVLTSTFPEKPESSQPDFVLQLSTRLASDFQVTVLAPDQAGIATSDQFEGIQVIRFKYWIKRYQTLSGDSGIAARVRRRPLRLLLVPLFLMAQILAARRLLKSGQFAVLHTHWVLPQGLCALLACRLAGSRIPVVTTAHGADIYALQWPGVNWLKAWVLRRSRAVAAVSRAMAADIRSLLANDTIPIHVMPMGVDLRHKFIPPGDRHKDPARILFVGRLVPKKGVHHLVSAMASVIKDAPAARLDIAGSGPEQERLQALTQALGLDAQIRFLGAVTSARVTELMQASGMVVVPSVTAADGDREGLGLVTIEAMGCACCVVAHDFAAVHDVIEDRETGFLIPQGDEQALARTLLELLADPGLQLETGSNARQSVLGKFDWQPATSRYTELFKRMIARKPQS